VVAARGLASMEIDRALYRGAKALNAEEKRMRSAGTPAPGEPCFGLSESECQRRARQLVARGSASCGRSDYIECQHLLNEALKLDPKNNEAWLLLVETQQKLAPKRRAPQPQEIEKRERSSPKDLP